MSRMEKDSDRHHRVRLRPHPRTSRQARNLDLCGITDAPEILKAVDRNRGRDLELSEMAPVGRPARVPGSGPSAPSDYIVPVRARDWDETEIVAIDILADGAESALSDHKMDRTSQPKSSC